MGEALAQFGLNVASEAAGAGMGLILGGINDKRQINQQQKLQDMQIKGQQQMANYNYNLQNAMWHATSYPEQVKMMNQAGLNPALMYGMGGGGGVTTGSQGGSVSGAQAPSGGGEAATMAGMGLQNAMSLKLMNAQAENITADTKLKQVDAAKKAGVDTKQVEAQTENIWQNTDNLRQSNQLQKLDITMKNIENFEKQASQEDRLDYIEYQAKIALKQLGLASNDLKLSNTTLTDQINRVKAEAVGAVLKNTLTGTQINKTNEEINAIAQKLMLDWDRLSNENKEIEIKKQLANWGTDPTKHAIDQMVNTMNTIIGVAGKKTGPTIINSYE